MHVYRSYGRCGMCNDEIKMFHLSGIPYTGNTREYRDAPVPFVSGETRLIKSVL